MPLQNRVTPFSAIEANPARGLFMGNRGCLHNNEGRLISQGWRTRTWIVCELEYKGQKLRLMAPGRYTQLFFLDEAVALAAGHRPCALCRRQAYRSFLDCCGVFAEDRARAVALDSALHEERVRIIRHGERLQSQVGLLPDGSFVTIPGRDESGACLKLGSKLLPWSFNGYGAGEETEPNLIVQVLTPSLTVQALRNGYRATLHGSARHD